MSLVQLSPKLAWSREGYVLQHWCPDCQMLHPIHVAHEGGRAGVIWEWNESLEHASFRGSLKHQVVVPVIRQGRTEYENRVCHYAITDGNVFFYGDSAYWPLDQPHLAHPSPYANMTIPLPDIPANASGFPMERPAR